MATFTMALKDVIETVGGEVSFDTGFAVMTGGDIGLNNYEIFNSDYREKLNGQIIAHYWNREICTEAIENWRLMMWRKMNEIMPVYNKLYQSLEIEFDPLSTIDMHSITSSDSSQTGTASNTSTQTSDSTSNSRSVSSDTPQTMLSGDEDYATSGADVHGSSGVASTGNDTSDQTGSQTSNSDNHVSGYQGAASDLIQSYRASLINVDLMIINELADLFMSVWNNGDSYTRGIQF